MNRIGFYAGSFDPFTLGHLHIVKEALTLFDFLIIGIACNPKKNSRRFPTQIMVEAINQTLSDEGLENKVKVISYTGLTYKEARKENATHLIRGLRNGMDYEYEENLSIANKKIGKYETIYFRSNTDLDYISSSMVMELYTNNEDISEYIPKSIYEKIKK